MTPAGETTRHRTGDGIEVIASVRRQPDQSWTGVFYLRRNRTIVGRGTVLLDEKREPVSIETQTPNGTGVSWGMLPRSLRSFFTARDIPGL